MYHRVEKKFVELEIDPSTICWHPVHRQTDRQTVDVVRDNEISRSIIS